MTAMSGGGGGGAAGSGVGSSGGNEVAAATLTNATSTGDNGGRANHFTGSVIPSAFTLEGTAPTATAVANSSFSITAGASNAYYMETYTPTGAFRVEMRVSNRTAHDIGLFIEDSGSAGAGNCIDLAFEGASNRMNLYHVDAGSFVSGGTLGWTAIAGVWYYLRIDRDGSNNWTGYASYDRCVWQQVATFAKTFTVAKLGIRGPSVASAIMSVDFIDVVS